VTPEEHKTRHVELHRNLDELWADWLRHNLKTGPEFRGMDNVTVGELIRWSFAQTRNPTEES
jgi:hypothetical protein